MPSLSLVMIVKNEAHCLADCLDSVRSIANEMVIGDTGSTDTTAELAISFGARVLPVVWQDDFAAARNAVLAAATGDWLLHLDADEVVDPESAARIRALVDSDGLGADAIEVILANYCDDPRAWRWVACAPGDPMARTYSGYIQVGLLRLFRNGRGYAYREPIHENITESVIESGGVIRAEPILIHHYGFQQAQSADAAKKAFYLGIGRKKVAQRPHDAKAWHELAEQLLACGHADEAEGACQNALTYSSGHIGATLTLANLLLNRGALQEARTILEGVHHEGAPPHVATALGAIAIRQGRHAEALAYLEPALASSPSLVMAALYLARIYDLEGAVDKAAATLEHLLRRTPNLKEAQDRLESHLLRREGERCFTSGDFQPALAALIGALRLDPDDPVTHNDLGVVTLALGDAARALAGFQRALALAPGFEPAQMNRARLS